MAQEWNNKKLFVVVVKLWKGKQHQMNLVFAIIFHLNGNTLGFHSQTKTIYKFMPLFCVVSNLQTEAQTMNTHSALDSKANIPWACHALILDCVMTPKNVCIGC